MEGADELSARTYEGRFVFFLFAHCTISSFSFSLGAPEMAFLWSRVFLKTKHPQIFPRMTAFRSFARRIASFHVNDLMFC